MNGAQWRAVALGAAVMLSAVAVLLGAPTWILIVLAALPWGAVAARRWSGLVAVPAVLIGSLWLLLALLIATAAAHVPMLPAVLALWTILGLGGAAVMAGSPVGPASARADRAVWAPAALGGALWVLVQLAAIVVPGAAGLAWTMQGDSANNVLFAREILVDDGIVVGPGESPVPLPNALMAVVMAAGRDGTDSAALLQHDVVAFAQVWSLQIVLVCLTSGAAAAAMVRAAGGGVRFVVAVSAIVSLLPLSWFFTGYPMEFGFFGVQVAMPIVLAAFVAFLGAERHPVIVLALQLLAATLLLTVWSPLVLMPAALGVVIVVRAWRVLVRVRGVRLAVLLAGIAQVVAYGLGVVLPNLIALSGFLTALGGVVRFRSWMLPAVLLVVFVAAVLVGRHRSPVVFWGPLALGLGAGAGVAVLLFVSRSEPDPWTYYPLKLAWVASAVLLPLALGLGMALIVRFRLIRFRAGGLAALLAAVAVFAFAAPATANGQQRQHPFVRILDGRVQGDGDEVAHEIFALADLERPRMLWLSGHPHEGFINFWLLEVAADSMSDNHALRQYAYDAYRLTDVADLCAIAALVGAPVEVLTADPTLEERIPDDCRPHIGAVTLQPVG